MQKINLSNELAKKVSTMVGGGFGLGRIFNHLRKLEICRNLSDLALLRIILYELRVLGVMPSRSKVGHHFRTKVVKGDWEGASVRELMKDLNNPTH